MEQGFGNSWAGKSELEKTMWVELFGPPEIKREERRHYLGEFRERVMKLLSKKQVKEPAIYPEIKKALQDKRATGVLISGDIDFRYAEKYEKLASEAGKRHSIIHDPEFKGDTGLVVISDHAVDIQDIAVRDREERLKELGVPPILIKAAGKKICGRCHELIAKADQEEVLNYNKLSLADRLMGDRCEACDLH